MSHSRSFKPDKFPKNFIKSCHKSQNGLGLEELKAHPVPPLLQTSFLQAPSNSASKHFQQHFQKYNSLTKSIEEYLYQGYIFTLAVALGMSKPAASAPLSPSGDFCAPPLKYLYNPHTTRSRGWEKLQPAIPFDLILIFFPSLACQSMPHIRMQNSLSIF